MRSLIFGLFIFVLSALAAAQADVSSVPLPTDVAIVKPDPSAPAEIARFSGAWKGAWDDVLPHVLVVEKIDHERNRLQVVYAHGANQGRNILLGNWVRLEGSFEGGKLKMINQNGASITYVLNDKGELHGRYMRGRESRVTMSRFELRPQ